jgi:hypothetical protein
MAAVLFALELQRKLPLISLIVSQKELEGPFFFLLMALLRVCVIEAIFLLDSREDPRKDFLLSQWGLTCRQHYSEMILVHQFP